jgi:hypothetical protein
MSDTCLSPAARPVAAPSMRGAARSWSLRSASPGTGRRSAVQYLRGAAVSQKHSQKR